MLPLKIHTSLLVCATIVIGIGHAPRAAAFEVAAGFAAIEAGDDRYQPAVALMVSPVADYSGHAYFSGTTYGPVRMESYLVSAARDFPVFKSQILTAHLGLCLLYERIILAYSSSTPSKYNKTDHGGNIGGNFGVALGLPKGTGPFSMDLSWDSHIFAAGLEGAIFLASGRKQTISLTMGWALR